MAQIAQTATRARPSTTTQQLEGLQPTEVLLHSHTHTLAPRAVPSRALGSAVLTWFGLVFAGCYVVLPMTTSALGLYHSSVTNLVFNTLALFPLAIITAGLAAVMKPKIVINKAAPRDPVLAATAGSLLVWALAHQLSPNLQPLSGMPVLESMTFVGLNVLEAGLFGMMLASFARTRARAFALGAAFQTLFIALFLGWIS